MAKKVSKVVKLQCEAGKASPAPPIGPALGQAGVNIMGFVKNLTKEQLNKLVLSSQLLLLYTKIEASLSSQKLHQLQFY